ncbi:MAG: diphthamide synthesis protein [Nanoarchaeota archaeon]
MEESRITLHKISVDTDYDLELERVISKIQEINAKLVCLQFPRGLMRKATQIASVIENNTEAKCLIWMEVCFGACDIPLQLEFVRPEIDLLIQFGHAKWKYREDIDRKIIE